MLWYSLRQWRHTLDTDSPSHLKNSPRSRNSSDETRASPNHGGDVCSTPEDHSLSLSSTIVNGGNLDPGCRERSSAPASAAQASSSGDAMATRERSSQNATASPQAVTATTSSTSPAFLVPPSTPASYADAASTPPRATAEAAPGPASPVSTPPRATAEAAPEPSSPVALAAKRATPKRRPVGRPGKRTPPPSAEAAAARNTPPLSPGGITFARSGGENPGGEGAAPSATSATAAVSAARPAARPAAEQPESPPSAAAVRSALRSSGSAVPLSGSTK